MAMPKHYQNRNTQAFPDWDETYDIMLTGLRERRSAFLQLFSQTEGKVAVEKSFVVMEPEIDACLKAIANILLRFLSSCAAVPDLPKGYLKQAIRSIGAKPNKLHAVSEQLLPEAVARLGDHYVGCSKKFARQWINYERGGGRLDLDRIKFAVQEALLALERELNYSKRGGPVVQELPRFLAAALARVLGYWEISIGRRVHEDGIESGNLKTLINIVKPLVDEKYKELTGHALSPDPMVRYAIARRKSVFRYSKLSYRGGAETDGNWTFSTEEVDVSLEGKDPATHNLRPCSSLIYQKHNEISQKFKDRRKATKG